MKKGIISILLAFVLLFTASGCSMTTSLSFSNAWNEGKSTALGFKETLEYTVELKKETVSGPNFSYTSAITDYDYNLNGTYVITVTATTNEKEKINTETNEKENINTDIFEGSLSVYKITSKLTLTGNYGEYQVEEDYVETECDFARESNSNSFFPIYSKTTNKSTILNFYENKYTPQEIKTVVETVYNKNSYTIKKDIYKKQEDTISSTTTKTYNKAYETYIDNSQLLFAIRNLGVEEESNKSLSVVSYAYGTAKSLNVQYLSKGQVETDLEVNTENKKANFSTDILSFGIASDSSSGMKQIIYLQNAKEDNTNLNRALIVKYIEPLTTYTTFNCMGSLVYTLNSVSIKSN